MLRGFRGDADRGGGTRLKKHVWLTSWAFARISLHLTDDEFLRYTPAQVAALTQAWKDQQNWKFAVALSCALNTKWSSAKSPVPFTPKQFLPVSPEDQADLDAKNAMIRLAQQRELARALTAYAATLPKCPPKT